MGGRMIKVTTRDGSEMYLNPDLIEIIMETPDTHITLSNGNRYLVLEPAKVVIGRIANFKAHLLRRAASTVAKGYLRRRDAERYHPSCSL
uniref:Flagellar FlbD family protein n=1 Tax=Geobacter sp. (strain M21) TaxID=443144 RepID=C6E7J4_GEOSM